MSKLRTMGRSASDLVRVFSGRVVVLVSAVLVAMSGYVIAPASVAAAEGKAPLIESVGWAIGGEIVVSARIDPDGLATSYEIKLACAICGPPGYAPATGQLPAVKETITESLNLTGIKPGSYRFEAYVHNAAGYDLDRSELTVPEPPPGAFPNGYGWGETYTPTISAGAVASGEATALRIFEEAEARRQQARKEEEVRHAAEQAETRRVEEEQAREAAARERREEVAGHPACVVPLLTGDTLATARHALAKAHCRLGRVHRPARRMRRHGRLRVIRQGARPGSHRRHRTLVALWLGVSGRRTKHGLRQHRLSTGRVGRSSKP